MSGEIFFSLFVYAAIGFILSMCYDKAKMSTMVLFWPIIIMYDALVGLIDHIRD